MWEYIVEEILVTGKTLENTLNKYGSSGWELVCINNNTTYVFKRNTQARNYLIRKK